MTTSDLLTKICGFINGMLGDDAPSSNVDGLPRKGPGISVQMAMVPEWSRRWIGGGGIRTATFTVIAQCASDKAQTAIRWLGTVADAFASGGAVLPGCIALMDVTATTVSIISRMDDGTVRYGESISFGYLDE